MKTHERPHTGRGTRIPSTPRLDHTLKAAMNLLSRPSDDLTARQVLSMVTVKALVDIL
jgi:hypothetical protein